MWRLNSLLLLIWSHSVLWAQECLLVWFQPHPSHCAQVSTPPTMEGFVPGLLTAAAPFCLVSWEAFLHHSCPWVINLPSNPPHTCLTSSEGDRRLSSSGHTISSQPHIHSTFERWREWGSERRGSLLKLTQVFDGKDTAQGCCVWHQSPLPPRPQVISTWDLKHCESWDWGMETCTAASADLPLAVICRV